MALSRAGAELARITFTGPRSRHVVLLPLVEGQPSLRIPDSPSGNQEDPSSQESATGEIISVDLSAPTTFDELLAVGGASLMELSLHLDAYSRARSW
jgi:hypothetical protein